MNQQLARVVSAACLFSAIAAAQAPSTLPSPLPVPSHGGGTIAADSSATDWRASRRLDFERLSPQDPGYQDPQVEDYSPYAQFKGAHGAFMSDRGRYTPDVSFEASLFPNQRIRHEPGSFDLLGYGFDADFPIALGEPGYLSFGAYAKSRHYQFTTATTLSDESVHQVGIKGGFGVFFTDDLLLEVEARPGMFSDADGGLHHEDFDVPAHALFTLRAADGLYWKGGLRYNQIYEDAPWLPYLGVSWNITSTMTYGEDRYAGGSWRLDVLLPEYAELSYWPSADTGYQFGFEVDGAEYHVRTSQATGRMREDLQVQEVMGYLGLTHRFNDNMSIAARAGAVLAGDYDLTNGATGFNRVEGALDQGFFFTVAMGFDW